MVMPADASIYGLIKPQAQQQGPLDQYAQAMQIGNLMDTGALNQLQRRQLERGIADDEGTSAAYREAGGDPTKVRDLLFQRGLYKPGMAADKAILENKKTGLDITHRQGEISAQQRKAVTDTMGQYRDQLSGISSPQAAAAWVTAGYNDPILGPIVSRIQPLEAALGKIPNDPQGFQRWVQENALGATKFMELNKPSTHIQNTGGTSNVLQVPGMGGAPTAVSSTPMTMTPDARASAVTVPDASGAYVPNQPVIDARTQIAKAGAPRTTVEIKERQRTFENEDKLRADHSSNPTVKSSSEMQNAFNLIEAAYKRPSAANDLAMATKYMKILDPTSVVRESEFALAVNATGLLDKVQNYAASVLEGKKLNPTQRKDFYDSAKAINEAFQAERGKVDTQFSELAAGYGLNPQNVIPSLRGKQEAPKPAADSPEATQTINGATYVKIKGKWFKQQ